MRSIADFFNKLTGRQAQRDQEQAATFDGLVALLANNKEPSVEDVEQVLATTGRTAADLRQAVELQVRRRELRAIIARGEAAQQERASIEEAKRMAVARLRAVEAEVEAVLGPLRERQALLDQAHLEADRAAAELRQLTPTVLQEEQDLSKRRLALQRRREHLTSARDARVVNLQKARKAARQAQWKGAGEQAEAEVKAREQDLAALDAEYAALTDEQASIAEAAEALEAARLAE